jgi:hypothetical protein
MLVSTGGINELSAKVKRFSGREFANFLGNKKPTSKEIKKENDNEVQKKDNKE